MAVRSSSLKNHFGRSKNLSAPRPLLSKKDENNLTKRQLEALNELENLIKTGVPDLTMSQIANKLKVSLRTLYELAPSKEELVLIAVDRLLFKIGKEAQNSIDSNDSPLTQLKKYLNITTKALHPTTLAFSRDFSELKGAKELVDAHENFVIALTQNLLKEAIKEKEIRDVDTAAFAHVLAGLGRDFNRQYANSSFKEDPASTAMAISEIIFIGLEKKTHVLSLNKEQIYE